jgi:hypothetical protein
MKNNIKTFIGTALMVISALAVIASVIWSLIFNLMNPDMTELRLFIENPYPTYIMVASIIIFLVAGKLIERD